MFIIISSANHQSTQLLKLLHQSDHVVEYRALFPLSSFWNVLSKCLIIDIDDSGHWFEFSLLKSCNTLLEKKLKSIKQIWVDQRLKI